MGFLFNSIIVLASIITVLVVVGNGAVLVCDIAAGNG